MRKRKVSHCALALMRHGGEWAYLVVFSFAFVSLAVRRGCVDVIVTSMAAAADVAAPRR